MPRDGIGRALDAATSNDRQQRIFVRADKAVPYGDVMEVMNLLRDAGYLKVALVGLESAAAAAAPGALPAAAPPASAPPATGAPAPGTAP